MISYLIQTVSTTLFGPVFASIIIIFELRNDSLSGPYPRIFEAAIDVADTVLKTNLFISFTVVIASIIRYTQIPPLGERNFLEILVGFQCMITSCFWSSCLAYGEPFVFKYLFYQLSITVLFFVGLLIGALPSSSIDILESVMTQCAIQRNYPLATLKTKSRVTLVVESSLLTVLIIGVIVFTFFKNPIQAVCGKLWKYFASSIRRYLHITSRCSFLQMGLLLATAFWMAMIIFAMVRVERIRQQLQKAAGPLTQDSQWGFGQVIAVISWAPVLHEILVKANGSFI